ncbi:MAG TPA: rod-binding protein [Pirellulales bacterium]|nr:rod-binding protein [Pirellulales bacterium]
MNISNLPMLQPAAAPTPSPRLDSPQLREAFDQFVGETFYGQMLASMRKTLGKPAYFHGGRAEEVFQGQLDQVVSEQLAKANADTLSGPMFDLFTLQRG